MVTKLNRKSLRAQTGKKEIRKSQGVFALPVTVLHANRRGQRKNTKRQSWGVAVDPRTHLLWVVMMGCVSSR